MSSNSHSSSASLDITGQLARYMTQIHAQTISEHVLQHAKFRVIDAVAAMVSGSELAAGEMAIRYVEAQGGVAEATVLATAIRTTAVNAALTNGMFAHADETDDFDPVTKAHPGSHVVPAALALAEREGSTGAEFLAAVTLGYDVCCRFLLALGPALVRGSHRSAEGTSSTMGAVAAAASLARLNEEQMRYALSYAAQQVSGIWSWVRDSDHVEKAFDFAGMGARNGVTAAIMAQMGFTGVWDVFDGEHNALIALSSDPKPNELVAGLGEHFFVTQTAIKPYSVGYPIQAPLSAFLSLQEEHRFGSADVQEIIVRLPEDGARIVNNRAMPDVNCQYIIAVALLDGGIDFASSHSLERMSDPAVLRVRELIKLVPDAALVDAGAPRSGHVRVILKNGTAVERFVPHAPGTKENPMTEKQVHNKAQSLIEPVLGAERTSRLLDALAHLEHLADMRELAQLLSR